MVCAEHIYTIGGGARNISIKKWDYFKIKIIRFIINFRRSYAIRYVRVQIKQGQFDEFISPDEGLFERNM